MLIGRTKERAILVGALSEEYSQFIAVYGRRRVGKTFLIRESYDYKFDFQFTGAANLSARKQLVRFRRTLKEHGQTDTPELTNWGEAFSELKRYISYLPVGKKVIFLDELPWMDSPRSGFLSELETFWNGWCSARKDIVLVACGSSTAWMVKKIIKNRGGLHNRLNHRIMLKPFSLGLCEKLAQSRGIVLNRKQLLEAYMIFGGVPYYWSLLQKGTSITQEIDRLLFQSDGELHDEFEMLYASLFKNPAPYTRVIELLATKKAGMTRKELLLAGKFEDNGAFSDILKDLEWCGFVRSYTMLGYSSKSDIFQLIDHYTLFYYEFINGKRLVSNYWKSILGTPKYNTWCGLAFERACLWHVDQIKSKLGINGILSSEYAWRCRQDESIGIGGTQIDLLIDRSDGIINLCEMKYSREPFSISPEYGKEIVRKQKILQDVTKTNKAIHIIMITTEGLFHNEQWSDIQAEITLDDLFAE